MGWGGEGKNPDIVLITVLNFRWEKPCSFREKWIFWKFRHDARKIYNNLFIMFNLTMTRKPSLWGRQLYFHPDDVQLRFHRRFQFSVLFSPRKLRTCCWLQIKILLGCSILLQIFQRSPQTWMRARKECLDAKMPTFNRVCSSSNAFRCSFSFVPYGWGE